jgi:hypothetical protein
MLKMSLLMAIIIASFSCTGQTMRIRVEPGVEFQDTRKFPAKIGLFAGPEYCQYALSKKWYSDNVIIQLGPALCDGTEKMLRSIFDQVNILKSIESSASLTEINAIVIAQVVSSDIILPTFRWEEIAALITVKYTFLDSLNRNTIWVDTFQGQGSTKLGSVLSSSKNIQKAMELAVEDQFHKAFEGIFNSNLSFRNHR